jgi:hypothetical protein
MSGGDYLYPTKYREEIVAGRKKKIGRVKVGNMGIEVLEWSPGRAKA